MKKRIPDWLLRWILNALLGEIYPNIRGVVAAFSDERELTLRYYLDRSPTDFDKESLAEVMDRIFDNTSSNSDIKSYKEECVYSKAPLSELDRLEEFIYARREYDMPEKAKWGV